MPKTPIDTQARSGDAPGFSFAREHKDGRLWLRALHRPDFNPICADWLNMEMKSRIQAGKQQLLARACGLPKATEPLRILDGTGGLGRDAYTLAALGAMVTLAERNPDIAALLHDARRRALEAGAQAAGTMELLNTNTLQLLAAGRRWDVVYLDPMYPDENRTALPQKEMQMFRDLTGGDADADVLLEPAMAAARKRVVVKRPLKAPPLAGREPSVQMKGTQARFDVYLVGALLGRDDSSP